MVGPELGPESADRVGVPCPALPYQYLACVSSLHFAELVMALSFLSQHPGWGGFCPFYLNQALLEMLGLKRTPTPGLGTLLHSLCYCSP